MRLSRLEGSLEWFVAPSHLRRRIYMKFQFAVVLYASGRFLSRFAAWLLPIANPPLSDAHQAECATNRRLVGHRAADSVETGGAESCFVRSILVVVAGLNVVSRAGNTE